VLNNLISDYELQMVIWREELEKMENPLEVKKLREELNLKFESLSIQSECSRENEEQALIKAKFKGEYCNFEVT
jgi:hypothetical protein